MNLFVFAQGWAAQLPHASRLVAMYNRELALEPVSLGTSGRATIGTSGARTTSIIRLPHVVNSQGPSHTPSAAAFF